MLPDAVHPDKEGAAVLAKTVYEGITGDFGGLQMPEIYTDNMVLQHGRLLTIQGKADAGEKVTVSIDRQQLQAVTGADGKWAVDVRPLKAGGPYTLTVSTENGNWSMKMCWREKCGSVPTIEYGVLSELECDCRTRCSSSCK